MKGLSTSVLTKILLQNCFLKRVFIMWVRTSHSLKIRRTNFFAASKTEYECRTYFKYSFLGSKPRSSFFYFHSAIPSSLFERNKSYFLREVACPINTENELQLLVNPQREKNVEEEVQTVLFHHECTVYGIKRSLQKFFPIFLVPLQTKGN